MKGGHTRIYTGTSADIQKPITVAPHPFQAVLTLYLQLLVVDGLELLSLIVVYVDGGRRTKGCNEEHTGWVGSDGLK